jgi:GAF domain-containing protein/class 3 adenylate cyclase
MLHLAPNAELRRKRTPRNFKGCARNAYASPEHVAEQVHSSGRRRVTQGFSLSSGLAIDKAWYRAVPDTQLVVVMKHLPVYRSKNKCFGAIQLQEQSTKAAKDNLRNELDRMQEREKATQKILRVIGESRADEEPVLDAIVEAAAQLCDANVVGLSLVDETRTRMHYTAVFGAKSDVFLPGYEFDLDGPIQVVQTVKEARTIHTADLADDPLYRDRNPIRVKIVEELGVRTFLTVPLSREGEAFGCLNLNRTEVRPFADDEILLIETFAQYAVIAIENVWQFREVQMRLEREKASREILEVISRSRDDETPVFEAILKNAARLCNAAMADLELVDEDGVHLREIKTWGPSERAIPSEECVWPMDSNYRNVVATREGRIDHIPDLRLTERFLSGDPMAIAVVEVEKLRTGLVVPLLKAGEGIGCLMLFRQEQKPFSNDEIALVETFSAQAVIAIENVRQFREVQIRLEREKASAEILEVISRSRADEKPVFDAILKNAAQLCDVPGAALYLVNEDRTEFVLTAEWGAWIVDLGPDAAWPLDGPLPVAQCIRAAQTVHLEDVTKTDLYRDGDPSYIIMADKEGLRSRLCVPLVSSGRAFGAIALSRREVVPFADDEIALIESFAAQAVIAIDNVRQFKALEARTEEVQKLNTGLESRVKAQVGEIERMGRLKRFLSPQVADAVLSSGNEDLLSSHRALLGILFCDIRGFTAFCETAEPEETIEVLQAYHEEMGALIAEHGAGVDTRAGDGIMVLFNDPLPCDDPARDALRLALAMRSRMEELCKTWRRHGHKLGFGVGISLGYATVGMVGAAGRTDYTASGTAVNLAARLCDKAADGEILLSPRAYAATAEEFVAEAIGEISLKGIHAQVEVFRVSEGH